MTQTRHLLATLKRCLRAKGLRYRDVAAGLGISEASVKRIFAEESFSLVRLEEVCRLLDITIYDLARMAAMSATNQATLLSLEQESALAEDPLLLMYFYLLLNGWAPSRIARKFRATSIQTTRILAKLDRLKLIELHPKNRVRLLTKRNIMWRKGGPIRRLYESQIRTEFLRSAFDGEAELMRLETGELTDASMKIMERKIIGLTKEFDDLIELDLSAPEAEKKSVGMLVALRPWVFSLVSALEQGRVHPK